MNKHTDLSNITVTHLGSLSKYETGGIVNVFHRIVGLLQVGGEFYEELSGRKVPVGQTFEDGEVGLAVKPALSFPSHAYFMSMTNILKAGRCTRMHYHTGPRLGFLIVGKNTEVRLASFVPIRYPSGEIISRKINVKGKEHNLSILTSGSFVSIQIPARTSHQFNTKGDNAVMLSIHIENHKKKSLRSQKTMVEATRFLQTQRDLLVNC